jgi:hypothetical protein
MIAAATVDAVSARLAPRARILLIANGNGSSERIPAVAAAVVDDVRLRPWTRRPYVRMTSRGRPMGFSPLSRGYRGLSLMSLHLL